MLLRCFRDSTEHDCLRMEVGMKLTMLAKDADSGNGGCPSVYVREDGMAVVQAPEVDAETFSNLQNALPGEKAVYIDPDVIVRAAEKIKHCRY